MPETEQQDRSLSETLVKEVVGMGMDTPMREPILEAVEEAEGRPSARQLPVVGAALGIGAGIGYLLGLQSAESLEFDAESIPVDEPDVVEDVMEAEEEVVSDVVEDEGEGGDGRRLPRIALVLAIAAGIAVLRRRMRSEGAEEWEPIEEFDTGTVGTEGEEAEAEADEPEATEERTDEETADEGGEEAEP